MTNSRKNYSSLSKQSPADTHSSRPTVASMSVSYTLLNKKFSEEIYFCVTNDLMLLDADVSI